MLTVKCWWQHEVDVLVSAVLFCFLMFQAPQTNPRWSWGRASMWQVLGALVAPWDRHDRRGAHGAWPVTHSLSHQVSFLCRHHNKPKADSCWWACIRCSISVTLSSTKKGVYTTGCIHVLIMQERRKISSANTTSHNRVFQVYSLDVLQNDQM